MWRHEMLRKVIRIRYEILTYPICNNRCQISRQITVIGAQGSRSKYLHISRQ